MAELKDSPGSLLADNDSGDGEFEPTVEMLVNDFDDERTLAEEEALEESETQEEEISNLTKEQDMPMEQLLAIYGDYTRRDPDLEEANGEHNKEEHAEEADTEDGELENDIEEADDVEAATSRSSASEENANINDVDKDTKLEGSKPERRKKEKPSDLVHLYPELDTNGEVGSGATARSLRSGSRQQSEDEDEDGDEVSGEEEEDWRKTIMIGSAFQAQVPEGLQLYGDTPPYENEDRLLWEPGMVNPDHVENYLTIFGKKSKSSQGVGALPLGSHSRDDEYALHLLLQCDYNIEEALRRQKMNPNKPVSQMTLWSEEECRNFENGLKTYGKDFHLIQQNKVRTRSVGELVQFYYLWKKTERHDTFATKTRLEKKKYIVHPGTTDYMDRFLDEGEGITSNLLREAPGMHALLYGKCPPGVAPPIPTSTLASSTITYVSAIAPSQHIEHNNSVMSIPVTSSIINYSASTPALSSPRRARSGSPRLETSMRLNNSTSSPGKVDMEVGNRCPRISKPFMRGIKRPNSPTISVSISQSISHAAIPIYVDSKSHHKTETVAL